VRLRIAGGEVRSRFATEGEPDDTTVEVDDVRIFIAPSVLELGDDLEVGVTDEHDKLVVRARA
jgi:hypothetical protein